MEIGSNYGTDSEWSRMVNFGFTMLKVRVLIDSLYRNE